MRVGVRVLQVLLAILSLSVIIYWTALYVDVWSRQPELMNVAGQPNLPKGITSFVGVNACPTGWDVVPDSAGRMILGANDKKSLRQVEGTALRDREDRTHYHHFMVSTTLEPKGISAKACCNWVAAKPGNYQSKVVTQHASSGLPFFQLPLCENKQLNVEEGAIAQSMVQRILYRGSVNYFTGSACPTGWQEYKPANKRFIVPMSEGDEPGLIVGDVFSPKKAFAHEHTTELTLSTQETSFIGVSGERALAKHGAYVLSHDAVSQQTVRLPYRSLLACALEHDRRVFVPSSFSTFMPREQCPRGWKKMPGTEKRYLVGMPKDADILAPFGGEPLMSGQLSHHQHHYRGNLHTDPEAVGLASGCCHRGFALGQTYSFSGDTNALVNEYPYVQLLQCVPESI